VGGSFYGLGLKLYQLLAGKYGFGISRILSKEETLETSATLKTEGCGRPVYYDDNRRRPLANPHVATASSRARTLLTNSTSVTKTAQFL